MQAAQIFHGLRWTTLATLVNVVAQFAFVAVLARLLEPAVFGLVLMANVSLRFAGFFAQMGTTQTLIQRPQLDRRFTSAALAVSVGVSALLYGVIALAAPLFAAYFRSELLAPVLWWYGATLVLGGLGGPPMALLRRMGRFRALSLIEVGSYLLGYGVTGIGCAWAGLGVWSLVYATLAQQGLVAVLSLSFARYPIRWPPERAALAEVWRSGSQYSLIGLLEFVWSNLESMLLGRWAGATVLGIFNRAHMLANLPVEQAMGAVHKVLFPALSSMQQDRARLADGFLVLLLASAGISVVVSAGVSAAAADVVALLLGPRWVEAGPLLAVLCVAIPALFSYVACGVTLDSLAALRPKLLLQAGLLAVKLVLVITLWQHSVLAVAWAVVLAEYLRLALGLSLLRQLLPLNAALLWRMAAWAAAAGATVHAAVAVAAWVGAALALPLVARLLLDTLAGLLLCALWSAAAARRGAHFPPLQRFELLRRWRNRWLAWTLRLPAP
jgi:lipopolysaccharide exporter